MEEKKASRNGLVDVMRLGFAGMVMMYHFYSNGKIYFPGGYLGVEFFSILAGFLMFSAWDRQCVAARPIEERQRYWLGYMKKRYIRFFWYCLVAFIFEFIVVRIWHDGLHSAAGICDALSDDIWEILLVKMNGLTHGKHLLNAPAWTMGCMLFADFFVLGMLVFWERPFQYLIMPLSIIFGIGWWMNLENNSILGFHTFSTFGMIRVYLLTCCGMLSYNICKRLKASSFSKEGKGLLTFAEVGGYILCILISCYRNSREYQFCFILIVTITLAASFSRKSFAGSILPANNFTSFCAELSLGIYLNHHTVWRLFRYIYGDVNDLYRQKFVFLYCALAVALAYTYIMRGVFKMLPIVKEKLKSVLLEQS